MDDLFTSLGSWADRLSSRGGLLRTVLLLAIVGVGAAVAGLFLTTWPALQVTLGSLAGLLWFVAGYLFWHSGLDQARRSRTDLRSAWSLPKRRWFVAWTFVGWALLVIFFNRYVPSVFVGAANVAVLLTLWRVGTASDAERAALEEEMAEAWIARTAAEAGEDAGQVPGPAPAGQPDALEAAFFEALGEQQFDTYQDDTYHGEGIDPSLYPSEGPDEGQWPNERAPRP